MGPLYPLPTHITDSWCSGNSMDFFGRCSVPISDGTPAIVTQVFSGFTQSPQDDAEIVAPLGHDHFLRNPFQPSLNHPTVRVLTQNMRKRLKKFRSFTKPEGSLPCSQELMLNPILNQMKLQTIIQLFHYILMSSIYA
jgi:hypothetical protein